MKNLKEIGVTFHLLPVKSPDKERVSTLIKKAIGYERSNKEFAELIGISEATLSRILTCKYNKHLEESVLKKIIDNQANPTNVYENVSLSELYEACGYMFVSSRKTNNEQTRLSDFRNQRERMGKIIKSALFERGIDLKETDLDYVSGTIDTVIGTPKRCDFATTINIEGDQYVGVFMNIPQKMDDFKSIGNNDPAEVICMLLNELSSVFLTDAWYPELYEKFRIHFCFVDRNLFEAFYEHIKQYPLNGRFSALLLDDIRLNIIEEKSFESLEDADNVSIFDRQPFRSVSNTKDMSQDIPGGSFLLP